MFETWSGDIPVMTDVSKVVFLIFPPIYCRWMNVQDQIITEAIAFHRHCVRDTIRLAVFETVEDTAAHT